MPSLRSAKIVFFVPNWGPILSAHIGPHFWPSYYHYDRRAQFQVPNADHVSAPLGGNFWPHGLRTRNARTVGLSPRFPENVGSKVLKLGPEAVPDFKAQPCHNSTKPTPTANCRNHTQEPYSKEHNPVSVMDVAHPSTCRECPRTGKARGGSLKSFKRESSGYSRAPRGSKKEKFGIQ